MGSEQDTMIFVNQFIIMLGKYREEITNRKGIKLLGEIRARFLQDVYYLYSQTEYDSSRTLSENKINKIYSNLFHTARIENSTYSIRYFNVGVYNKKNINKESKFFFHQLLLILELEEIETTDNISWYKYLVDIPKRVFQKRFQTEQERSMKTMSVEQGMDIVGELIKQYFDILYPLNFEEYRADFLWIKSFYENIFYQYEYSIVQGKLNEI